MTNELTRFYNTLLKRDANDDKYYFALNGITLSGENEITTPLLTRTKKARGAEVFKQQAEFCEKEGFDFLEYKEYKNLMDEDPQVVVRIPSKRRVSKQPALKNDSYFDQIGGLHGVFERESLNNRLEITNQYLERDLAKVSSDYEKISNKYDAILKENEELKRKIEQSKDKEEKLRDKLTVGSLITKGFLGIISDKIGLTEETLKGFVAGVDEPQAQPTQSEAHKPITNIVLEDEDPIITEICNYLKSSSPQLRKQIYGLLQWINQSANNIDKIFAFLRQITKQNQTNLNGTTQSNIDNTSDIATSSNY